MLRKLTDQWEQRFDTLNSHIEIRTSSLHKAIEAISLTSERKSSFMSM